MSAHAILQGGGNPSKSRGENTFTGGCRGYATWFPPPSILDAKEVVCIDDVWCSRLARIRKVLSEVKLHPVEDFLQKFPHMLSGGQQQRIVIARAMLREPKLIVADEPVSMLDASVRVEILKLMRALQESHGLSVIYITHDLSTVKYFSRRIFVMYAGNLIEKAETRRLLENPLHPYTHALLAATSDPDARNADTFKEVPPGEPPSLVNPPTGCRFHLRCPQFIAGLCDVKEPPDFETEPEHFVACWLYEPKPQ